MADRLTRSINAVKEKFISNHAIKIRPDWIEECVKFFLSESPDASDEFLYNQAKEQFLVADLKEASSQTIPTSIRATKSAFVLNGRFVWQLETIIDIAESPYEQWRRLHNIRLDEVEESRESKGFQTKKKRVFKLELTDGYETVYGMEYATITALNTKLSPGVKLQIVGPVQVVNHILLLEPKNVVIMGGEVDDLLIKNAYENVLLKALGKPLTNEPVMNYKEELPNQENTRINDTRHNIAPRPMPESVRVENNLLDGIDFDAEEDVDMEMLLNIESENRNANARSQQIIIDDEDDAFLAEIDLDNLERASQRPPFVPEPFTSDIELLTPPVEIVPNDEEAMNESLNQSPSYSPIPREVGRVDPVSIQSRLSHDDYKHQSPEGFNYVTVDQYLSISTMARAKKSYMIRGILQKVELNTLRINRQWSLVVDVTDSYSRQLLPVSVHSDILEKLSGHTAQQMRVMQTKAKDQPQLKSDIQNILKNLQGRLENLQCFMKIAMKFDPSTSFHYELLEICDENRQNTSVFAKKLKEENISEC